MHITLRKTAFALIITLISGLFACGGQEKTPEERFAELITMRAAEGGVSRADPGYMQYLERLSLKSNAARLAQMVSGSNFVWRRPSGSPRPAALTSRSDVWLDINPHTLQTPGRSSVLGHLASPALWASLEEAGITGLYIAPTGGGAALWDADQKRSLGAIDDTIQYSFAKGVGTEQEYARIIERAKAANILLGGELVPAATGIGPDFFLAVRNLRDYPGLYCLIEVPKNLWGHLPAVKKDGTELEVYQLARAQAERLSREGLFPGKFRQDALYPALDTGWAATGEIRGNDGNLRRWVYRYAYDYKRPVLNFSDPSNAARQVMSGSVIFQSGVLGNSLSAQRLTPLAGLEPDSAPPAGMGNLGAYALLMEISAELSRQTRAYGAHAWLKDPLPLPVLHSVMQNGPDLVLDSLFSPAAEHALLTGDASLIGFMADEALNFGIDWTRLVHASSGHAGVDYSLPHLEYLARLTRPESVQQFRIRRAKALLEEVPRLARAKATMRVGERPEAFFEKNRLYTTPLGVAAMAAGVFDNFSLTPQLQAEIRRGHMLLQFFRAFQPGVFMISGQDLTGTMPVELRGMDSKRLTDKRLMPLGSYPLLSSAESGIFSSLGIPRAKSLYGGIDMQLYNPASFVSELKDIIAMRRRLNIAKGTVVGRFNPASKGISALVTRLPASYGSPSRPEARVYAVSIVNFSREESSEYFDLGSIPELAEILPGASMGMISGNFLSIQRQDNWLFFRAPGWSRGLVLIEEGEKVTKPETPVPASAPETPAAPGPALSPPEEANRPQTPKTPENESLPN